MSALLALDGLTGGLAARARETRLGSMQRLMRKGLVVMEKDA